MPPLFNPRLINPPAKDPGLFIPFFFNKRAVLIDPGDISSLSSRDILKISQLFVSHTHMDHFTGFDRILRLMLGRNVKLSVFGPKGIIDNVRGKFAAYTWNLVENYTNSLSVRVWEVLEEKMISCGFNCQDRFRASGKKTTPVSDGVVFRDTSFEVESAILDHGIPCLGFALKEHFHVNIRADALKRLGLKPDHWLYEFKEAIMAGEDPEKPVLAPAADDSENGEKSMEFTLKRLADEITVITPGEKIAYITDVSGSQENIDKIIGLAKNADHLFIEAAFLEKDRKLAEKKYHLTAFQAGMIAAKAGVRRYTLFHFSPRYTGSHDALYAEAEKAFLEFGGKHDMED